MIGYPTYLQYSTLDDNESRELRIIDFVEMKTKKGPDLKAIKKSCKNLTESNKGMQYVWIQVLD